MKITYFKMPVILERDKDDPKTVKLTIKEDEKVQDKVEELSNTTQDIVSLSKKIADYNDLQKQVLTNSLFASESRQEGFIVMQYLTE